MKNKNIKFILSLIVIVCAVIVIKIFVFDIKYNDRKIVDTALIGYWKGDTEENPGFEIKGDRLYLDETPSKYVVDSSENITIYYTGFVFTGKYKVENNKLYITSEGSTDIYSRWCPDKNDICS